MSKKLGHNPLGGNHLDGAKFDFIPYTEQGSAGKKTSRKKTTKKKVVSYYLEEDLIKEIRQHAKENEVSFSSYVSDLLSKAIKENEE